MAGRLARRGGGRWMFHLEPPLSRLSPRWQQQNVVHAEDQRQSPLRYDPALDSILGGGVGARGMPARYPKAR